MSNLLKSQIHFFDSQIRVNEINSLRKSKSTGITDKKSIALDRGAFDLEKFQIETFNSKCKLFEVERCPIKNYNHDYDFNYNRIPIRDRTQNARQCNSSPSQIVRVTQGYLHISSVVRRWVTLSHSTGCCNWMWLLDVV